jgi:predicted ATPase
MIQQVSVSSFKAIEEATIDLPALTIFIGENGTGKSSIIQALSILSRSRAQQQIITDLPYVNLGPLTDLVPLGKEAFISIRGKEEALNIPPIGTHSVSYTCKVMFDIQGMSGYECEIEYGPFKHSNSWSRYGGPSPQKSFVIENITFNFAETNIIGHAFTVAGYGFQRAPESEEESRRRQYSAQILYQSWERLSLVIDQDLRRFFVVPPLRGLTETTYSLPQTPNQEIPFRSPQSQTQVAGNLKYWEENARKISQLLSQIVGVELQIALEAGPIVRILNRKGGVNFVNEGFGANQLLFVFERIINSPEQSLIAIEEPENHLHPKAQFMLGKLLCEIASGKTKRLLLASHSPHLLSGILTSVKSKKIAPSDVAVYYFQAERGFQVKRAHINDQGMVTEGLKGFMEAAANELIEYASAGTAS